MKTGFIRAAGIAIFCAGTAACTGISSGSAKAPPAGPFISGPLPVPPQSKHAPPVAPHYTGLTAVQLRTALGTPSFVRKDGADELWRYDGAGCRAFFFLYPKGDALQVRHVETVPRGSDASADPSCLDGLRAQSAPMS